MTWRSSGVEGGGAPGTKYFALWAPPVGFEASHFGVNLELKAHGGAPYVVPLHQFEMHFADLHGWAGNFVAMRYADRRCVEIAVHFQRVICRRHTFSYDAAGRIKRRVDTDYQWRLGGESPSDWAKRWEGRTPPVTCVVEFGYAWSEDGRTVEVTLRSKRGEPKGLEPIDVPYSPLVDGRLGQKLETWRLNTQGAIVSVLCDGNRTYAARYDDAGRLLSYEREGKGKVANRYDAQGRLVERRIDSGIGRKILVLHQYPNGPKMHLPSLGKARNEAWLVTHDADGWICRIREHGGPSDDIMANTYQEFKRDRGGRIVWRRLGFVLPNGRDSPLPIGNWGF